MYIYSMFLLFFSILSLFFSFSSGDRMESINIGDGQNVVFQL